MADKRQSGLSVGTIQMFTYITYVADIILICKDIIDVKYTEIYLSFESIHTF